MHPPHFRTIMNELHLPLYAIELLSQWKKLFHTHPPNFKQQPVLVLPGFGASDNSTYFLRTFLQKAGLEVYGWKLGKNKGNVRELVPKLIEQISQIKREHNEQVTLIGWSLGGLIARELSRRTYGDTRAVCCLGSPIIGGPAYTIYARLFQYLGKDLSKTAKIIHERESVPIHVPSHVIYSKKDGIVHWKACIDQYNEHTTHTELNTPHFSMGTSVEIYSEILRWLNTIHHNSSLSGMKS